MDLAIHWSFTHIRRSVNNANVCETQENSVTARPVAIAISGVIAILCVSCEANAQDLKFNVCMGNGGGASCEGGNTVRYTCSQYKAIGGGGPATPKALGERLCKIYKPDGKEDQLSYNIAHIYSRPGGECGWTLFTVTCFRPSN